MSEPTNQQPGSGSGYPPPPPYNPPYAPQYAPPYPPPPGYPPMAPYGVPGMPVQARTSGMAIASLIFGIVGLCSGIAAILGIIFGHLALNEINKSGGMVQGRGMAIAGLVLGYAVLGLVVLYIFFTIAARLAFR